MHSSIFPIQTVTFSNGSETVLPGGRKLFPLLPQALEGVKTIGFIGWGSQGPAQSQNFRDTLASIGSDIVVRVGLRADSPSREKARAAGFTEESGTLGDVIDVVRSADFVIALIADGGMVNEYKTIFANMKPGATLWLSHGFLKGYLDSIWESFPEHIDVVLMAPKGMGPSVRRLYVQWATREWAGINSSIGVERDVSGKAWDRALAWAVATGSPVTFETTMTHEVRSDLYGERWILLGGIWAIAEVTYEKFVQDGSSEKQAFQNSANALVGAISQIISEKWLRWAYESLDADLRKYCERGYNIGYTAGMPVLEDIYMHVCDGREIRDVIAKTADLQNHPMPSVEASPMWQVGKTFYEQNRQISKEISQKQEVQGNEDFSKWVYWIVNEWGKSETDTEIRSFSEISRESAFTLGIYMGIMVAQIDLLRAKWHHTSEIVNESLIEAIDSLNPYMWARGVAYMVDNCSITARLGTRKWGPVFMEALRENMDSIPSDNSEVDCPFDDFLTHSIHADIATCFGFRPSVKIAVE